MVGPLVQREALVQVSFLFHLSRSVVFSSIPRPLKTEKDPHHPGRICIRRFLNLFLVLYRHVHLAERCIRVERSGLHDMLDINTHHAVAGSDDFDSMSMNWDLVPGAKINYMHDFPGDLWCLREMRYIFCDGD